MYKPGTDETVKLMERGPHGWRKEVKVDACLAELVQVLNDYGIETMSCCCGHGKVSYSYIRISSQNIELIPMGEDLTVHLKFPYPGERK